MGTGGLQIFRAGVALLVGDRSSKDLLLPHASAVERRARAGEAPEAVTAAFRNLTDLMSCWKEIHASDSVRRAAIRCVRTAGVRSGDSLHLAAATIASGFEPTAVRFLTEDVRVRAAAEREGFLVE
jgi:hypothetical protein